MRSTELLVRSLVNLFLPLFCILDLDSNGLIPAAREIMMLSRLLTMPGVEHAVQIIGVYSCLFVMRPRGSMGLQGSRSMNAPGIL